MESGKSLCYYCPFFFVQHTYFKGRTFRRISYFGGICFQNLDHNINFLSAFSSLPRNEFTSVYVINDLLNKVATNCHRS